MKTSFTVCVRNPTEESCTELAKELELPFAPYVGLKLHLNQAPKSQHEASLYRQSLVKCGRVIISVFTVEDCYYSISEEKFHVSSNVKLFGKPGTHSERHQAAVDQLVYGYGFTNQTIIDDEEREELRAKLKMMEELDARTEMLDDIGDEDLSEDPNELNDPGELDTRVVSEEAEEADALIGSPEETAEWTKDDAANTDETDAEYAALLKEQYQLVKLNSAQKLFGNYLAALDSIRSNYLRSLESVPSYDFSDEWTGTPQPVSILPESKKKIKKALKRIYRNEFRSIASNRPDEDQQEMLDELGIVYSLLGCFVDDEAHELVIIDEQNRLLEEWNTFKAEVKVKMQGKSQAVS